MFRAFDVQPDKSGPRFSAAMEDLVLEPRVSISIARSAVPWAREATAEHHRASSVASGSSWSAEQLARAYTVLSQVPFSAQVLPQCEFLHFGTTRQLITSGLELLEHDNQPAGPGTCLSLNNRLTRRRTNPRRRQLGGRLPACGPAEARRAERRGRRRCAKLRWNCRLGACLDVIAGETRSGRGVWFVRAYHVGDTFKDTLDRGATLAGQPLVQWLAAVGAKAEDVWAADIPPAKRSLWDARVFPAIDSPQGYRDWLWMFDPATATAAQKASLPAGRSLQRGRDCLLADMDAFYSRRGCEAVLLDRRDHPTIIERCLLGPPSLPSTNSMRYALIIAGGSGTRLWPMSRGTLPKQLIPFIAGKSLLEIAYERLEGLVPADRRLICAGEKHARVILDSIPGLTPEAIPRRADRPRHGQRGRFRGGRDRQARPGRGDRRLYGRPSHSPRRSLPGDHRPGLRGGRKPSRDPRHLRHRADPGRHELWLPGVGRIAGSRRPRGRAFQGEARRGDGPDVTSPPGRSATCGTAACSSGGPQRSWTAFAVSNRPAPPGWPAWPRPGAGPIRPPCSTRSIRRCGR